MKMLRQSLSDTVTDFLTDWSLPRQLAGLDPLSKAAESTTSRALRPRLEQADTVGTSVCPFCAVGCGQLVYAKNGRPIHIEGDPRSPVNQGTLCPKGASTLGVLLSPQRINTVLYRAPRADATGKRSRSTGRWSGSPQLTKQVARRHLRRDAAGRPDRQPHPRHSARSAAPPWTTRKTTSSRSCSAAASAWSVSRTRRGSDTPPRCPVWARVSAAALPPWPFGTWKTPTASSSWAPTWRRTIRSASASSWRRKRRGATVIHVDPRFTRTSALADIHAPIRSGTRHRLPRRDHPPHPGERPVVPRLRPGLHQHRPHHRGRLPGPGTDRTACSPASTPTPGPTRRTPGSTRARSSPPRSRNTASRRRKSREAVTSRHDGRAAADGSNAAASELRLPDHAAPLRALHAGDGGAGHRLPARRHSSRVAEALTRNSGRERTGAFCYAVGWTHHTVGVQIIRAAAIIQGLLGNIGRPGGGILALRGHASIQGSTDIPTLYNMLPTYLPQPNVFHQHGTLQNYLDTETPTTGWWANMPKYVVSLLKAWYGEHAKPRQRVGLPVRPQADRRRVATADDAGDAGRRDEGPVHPRPEPGGRRGQLRSRRARPGEAGMAGGPRLRDDGDGEFLAEGPPRAARRIAAGGHRHRGLLPAGLARGREGRHGHQHQPPRAVARRGAGGAGRQPLRPVVHLPPRQAAEAALRRQHRTARRADPGADLGLSGARQARRARRRGGAAGDQRLHRRRPQADPELSGVEGRRQHRLRRLDVLRRLSGGRPQRRPVPQARRAGRPRQPRRLGVRLAVEPAHALQPRLRRPGWTSPGPSARRWSGGTRRRANGPATTCPISSPPSARTTAPTGPRARTAWTRSAATTHSSWRPTASASCSCRPA